jgi:hypothetical protein
MKGITRVTVFALLASMMTTGSTGCTNQATVSALVTTLGNACASIAAMEGNSALAEKMQKDTADASTAVLNWKTGTPANDVIQAINIVESDLNDICALVPSPQCVAYEPLIILALSTAESIIAIVNPKATTAQAHIIMRREVVIKTAGAPKNSDEFKKKWAAIVKANPLALSRVAIK